LQQTKDEAVLEALKEIGEYAYNNGLKDEFHLINEEYKRLYKEYQMERPAWVTLH